MNDHSGEGERKRLGLVTLFEKRRRVHNKHAIGRL